MPGSVLCIEGIPPLFFSCLCLAQHPPQIRNTMLLGILAFTSLLTAAGITISFFHLDKSSMVSVRVAAVELPPSFSLLPVSLQEGFPPCAHASSHTALGGSYLIF